jgi:hypothetical protein
MMPKAIRPSPEMTVMAWWTRRPASRRTSVMAADKAVNQVAVPRPIPARSSTAAVVEWVMRAVEADHDPGDQPARDHAAGRQQPDGPDLRGDEEPESEASEQRCRHGGSVLITATGQRPAGWRTARPAVRSRRACGRTVYPVACQDQGTDAGMGQAPGGEAAWDFGVPGTPAAGHHEARMDYRLHKTSRLI